MSGTLTVCQDMPNQRFCMRLYISRPGFHCLTLRENMPVMHVKCLPRDCSLTKMKWEGYIRISLDITPSKKNVNPEIYFLFVISAVTKFRILTVCGCYSMCLFPPQNSKPLTPLISIHFSMVQREKVAVLKLISCYSTHFDIICYLRAQSVIWPWESERGEGHCD